MSSRLRCLAALLVFVGACGEKPPPPPSEPPAADDRARALADGNLTAWLDRNPDQATIYGISGADHDRLPDNSLEALRAWQSKEDALLEEARKIEPAAVAERSFGTTGVPLSFLGRRIRESARAGTQGDHR